MRAKANSSAGISEKSGSGASMFRSVPNMNSLLLVCQKTMKVITTQYGSKGDGGLPIFKDVLQDLKSLEK